MRVCVCVCHYCWCCFGSVNAKPNKHTIIHSKYCLRAIKIILYTLLAIKCCCITIFWCVPWVLSFKLCMKMKNSIRNICTREHMYYSVQYIQTHTHIHKQQKYWLSFGSFIKLSQNLSSFCGIRTWDARDKSESVCLCVCVEMNEWLGGEIYRQQTGKQTNRHYE